MDPVDLVMALEGDNPNDYTEGELLEAIAEHKETLRHLQGSYGRMVASLEEQGMI